MNRKLHNTLMAIIASTSLLTLGLIAGTPPMPHPEAAVEHHNFLSVEGEPARPDASPEVSEAGLVPSQAPRRVARRSQQSVSMPFFSFVPRG